MVEDAPGSQNFMFGTSPAALAIMREHNRLWAAKHGDAAVEREEEKHAAVCAIVRERNRKNGFTDAEIDDAFAAARRRYAGKPTTPTQAVLEL